MTDPSHYGAAPRSIGFAVVTVSDTRTEATDLGGKRLAELVAGGGYRVARRALVSDSPPPLRAEVERSLANPEVDCLLITGGTGVARRDVSIETIRPLFEKELAGFGEIFRALSFAEIGPAAMLTRATAGVARGKAIFLLPGSPGALELAMKRLVLPEIGHLLGQARRAD